MGEERRIVAECAFWDRNIKETVNILASDTFYFFPESECYATIAFFAQGEVLSDSLGKGSLQRIREL